MKYSYTKKLDINFDQVVTKTKEELTKEGFGVLTEIDVKKTMKTKLGLDYDNYIILGACNPEFADKALQIEKEIGLLLPCNVIIYEKDISVFVSVILPTVAMNIVQNSTLNSIAVTVEEKLKKVIDELGSL